LDLVITVDTAMAHLAGLLQRPVWVLLPFSAAPRWGLTTSTSIWYPTMQLFRQHQPWIWHDPIEQVIAALATQLDQRSLG
jgi:ADP-heptose:LPS heptosyltransferase